MVMCGDGESMAATKGLFQVCCKLSSFVEVLVGVCGGGASGVDRDDDEVLQRSSLSAGWWVNVRIWCLGRVSWRLLLLDLWWLCGPRLL